jgi:hypothetical protein
VPFAVCRRWPVACLALVSLGFAVDQLRGYHSFADTALAVMLVIVGSRLERHRFLTALLFSAAYVALSLVFPLLGAGERLSELVTFYLLLVFVWGVGSWLRSTRAAEAERRRRLAADTRDAERTRIAGELHDIVTHHSHASSFAGSATKRCGRSESYGSGVRKSSPRGGHSRIAPTGDGLPTHRRRLADDRHVPGAGQAFVRGWFVAEEDGKWGPDAHHEQRDQ